MIRIVNCRTHHGAHIYVGRPSPLGNPFAIGRDGDRDAVIAQYRHWLWQQVLCESGAVWDELQKLVAIAAARELVLGCWCSPQPCHADVIKNCVEYLSRCSSNQVTSL